MYSARCDPCLIDSPVALQHRLVWRGFCARVTRAHESTPQPRLAWKGFCARVTRAHESTPQPRLAWKGFCARVTRAHESRLSKGRVSPFGYLRINARLPAPRSFSQAATSFIACNRQGIHHMHLFT